MTTTSVPRRLARHGPLREALERAGEPTRAVESRPRGVELRGTAATRGKLVEERGKARDDGPLEADRSRTARRAAEQRRSTPELDPHVHHDPLALRIDRRVGDLGECLAEVVGDRPVEPGASRSRRVVAHAPQRFVALERHRLDVESVSLRVQPGEIAHAVVERRPRLDLVDRRLGGSSWIGRGSSWIGRCRRTRAFASVSSRIDRRSGSTSSISPGPSRPRRTVSAAGNGTAPASDASATSRSRVTANAAGRSPLRSTRAPTRRPSAKTIAAGPSHGASIPAVRRRSVATCGCGARRSPSASGIAASSAGASSQPVVVEQLQALVQRQRIGAVRREQRAGVEQVRGDGAPRLDRGAAADLLAIATDRVDLTVMRDRTERLREPPDRGRVGRVALVEQRVADLHRGAQIGIEVREPRPGDQALVHDRPARHRRDRHLRKRPAGSADRLLEAATDDDEPSIEGLVRRANRAPRRSPARRWAATQRPRLRVHSARMPRSASRGSTARRRARLARRGPGAPAGRPATSGEEQHRDPRLAAREVAGDQRQHGRRQGERDAGSVAGFTVGTERAAVGQRGQPPERQWQHPVRDRPPASATNPTPHASCSNRGSYSGARESRWSLASISLVVSEVAKEPPSVGRWRGPGTVGSVGGSADEMPGGVGLAGRPTPLARSGRQPRRGWRDRCRSPRRGPTPGSRGSGRRP